MDERFRASHATIPARPKRPMQRGTQSHSAGDCSPVGPSPGTSMGRTNVTCSQHVPDTYIPQSTAGRRPRGKRAGGAPHERQGKGCPPVDGPPCLPSSHHFTSLLYSPPHSFIHPPASQQEHVESRSVSSDSHFAS